MAKVAFRMKLKPGNTPLLGFMTKRYCGVGGITWLILWRFMKITRP